MKLAALFSGGKDSNYALHYAMQQGFEVVCLVSVVSKNPESYMYHTINIDRVPEQARALGLKLYRLETEGVKEEEVEDLEIFLEELKSKEKIDGVLVGALASDYQKTRIEKICEELGLASICPLWHVDPETYMHELIDAGFDARIAGVFAEGLDESWIGKRIDESTLKRFKELKVHLGGEGGEYESMVVDGPGFKEKLEFP
jgi:ABC transporter with metal-binding/Fe-S-binding domain ATP-binding protein